VSVRKLAVVFVILLVAYLLTGVTQVRPGERAVVRRFGRVAAVPPPGLYVGLPWGMDRVDRVRADFAQSIAVGYPRDWDDDGRATPPGQLLTGDHNLVNVRVELEYHVDQETNEDQVVQYVLHADRTDALVARAAEAALAEWAAQRTVDDVLVRGKAVLPDWLPAKIQERIDPYGLGIRIRKADVADLLPPGQVKPAFDAVTSAQTAKGTRETKARQEADRLRREADRLRIRTEQATAAEVNAVLQRARTEAETFSKRVDEYHRLRRQNPNVLAALWWDEMGRLFLQMQQKGRIDLLDKHLAGDGLDITLIAPQVAPPKK
jgi:membrane protease subunit HflK